MQLRFSTRGMNGRYARRTYNARSRKSSELATKEPFVSVERACFANVRAFDTSWCIDCSWVLVLKAIWCSDASHVACRQPDTRTGRLRVKVPFRSKLSFLAKPLT